MCVLYGMTATLKYMNKRHLRPHLVADKDLFIIWSCKEMRFSDFDPIIWT